MSIYSSLCDSSVFSLIHKDIPSIIYRKDISKSDVFNNEDLSKNANNKDDESGMLLFKCNVLIDTTNDILNQGILYDDYSYYDKPPFIIDFIL